MVQRAHNAPLEGLSILILEDEFLVALAIEEDFWPLAPKIPSLPAQFEKPSIWPRLGLTVPCSICGCRTGYRLIWRTN
ncbi:MAG: hypothetical protein MK180_11130 [Rhodobacteraceae bacterium]|nr:hypothetical protein [Paracoccaceae bacterium]